MERFDFKPLSDCSYYYSSTCSRGGKCLFRHLFKNTNNVLVCDKWNMYNCFDKGCKYLHPVGPIESYNPSSTVINKADNASRKPDYDMSFEDKTIVLTEINADSKQNINCKYYLHGKCTRGKECSYLHETSDTLNVRTTDINMTNECIIPQAVLPHCIPIVSKQSTITNTNTNREAKSVLSKYSLKRHIAEISKEFVGAVQKSTEVIE